MSKLILFDSAPLRIIISEQTSPMNHREVESASPLDVGSHRRMAEPELRTISRASLLLS